MRRPEIRFFSRAESEIIEASIEKKQTKEGNITNIEVVNLIYALERPKDSKPVLPIDPKIFSDEFLAHYQKLRSELDKCVELAQRIEDYLSLFLRSSKSIFDPENEDSISSLDFMTKRSLLSNYLKQNASILENTVVNSRDRLKMFTKTFFYFIEDRNKYTHGTLMFEYPSLAPIIKYIDSNEQVVYAQISKDVIQDYFRSYDYISRTLNNIKECLKI